MRHQINIITIGVRDLGYMANWYEENFNWVSYRNEEGTIFFRLQGLTLVLVRENKLAQDVYTWQDGRGFKKFMLTIGFDSEYEVDNAFEQLEQNGVMIIERPKRVAGGGYKGYIADPEDNFWELSFYPYIDWDTNETRFSGQMIRGLHDSFENYLNELQARNEIRN